METDTLTLEQLAEREDMTDAQIELCREAEIEPYYLDQYLRSGFDLDNALSWLESDFTVDQAKGWENHGCGPGDALGCWTNDPDEAFAKPDKDDDDDDDDDGDDE
jgi:hypothetical protein